MVELFLMGGPVYMGILTLLLAGMVAWMLLAYSKYKNISHDKMVQELAMGKSIGLFAMVLGILFQLIGFYEAFSRLEEVGQAAPNILYGGIKISMITTIYGVIIYLTSWILWFMFSIRKTTSV